MDALHPFFSSLSPATFIPLGVNYHWINTLVTLNVVADLLLAFSSLLFSGTVVYFLAKRNDIDYSTFIVFFCSFVFLIALTELVDVWLIWHGTYWFATLLKMLTAVVGVTTLVFLWRAIPRALQLPSRAMLEDANHQLEQEVRDRKTAEVKLSYLAYHDSLTNLPNRSFFHHALSQILMLNKRNPQRVAVLFIDLDRFKQVNDSFSHEVGDMILQQVSERLSECIRLGDVLARLGGDEFGLIVLEKTQAKEIEALSQRILEKLLAPLYVEKEKIFLTASIGISFSPENGETAPDLMKNADIALYQAKALGKNNFQFSSSALESYLLEEVKLGMDLRVALERSEFELYYQPKVSLKSGLVVGLEALLRWKQPDQTVVMPSKFIPISEENGLILPIGDWVLKTACRQSKLWIDQGFPPISVAINVSARQFQKGDIIQDIVNIIEELALDPTFIEIEITESILMQDIAKSIISLRKLKAFGVTVAIDDFGTGYSSFNYLKRFDVDKIKIDQSFVKELTNSSNEAAIVKAIISMAHSLGIKVVAEGVETAEQLNFLKTYLCDEIQGYYLGYPMPPDEVTAYLRAGKIMKL